jgi:predicted negative regulator of RcsB-dependent stress response
MKSEERHKLHQNALAVWLAETITKIKPYQNYILAAGIVLILALIVTAYWTSESASQANAAWSQFFTAFGEGNPSALEKVAEDNRRSHAAPVAELVAADIQLAQGCNMLFTNKAIANQQLVKALELYQRVREHTNSPALRAQATFGLARVWESMGKLDTAIKLYTEVTTEWPDSVFAQASLQRLENLKRISIKDFYDKFAKFDPKPVFNQQSAVKPGFDKLPEESSISTPDALNEQGIEEKNADKVENKTENQPDVKTDKPAENSEKTMESQPAPTKTTEMPVESQPAPSTDKPAQ